MNQTLLIVLGVTVFTMTVVGVLIYFYSLFERLAAGESVVAPSAPGSVLASDVREHRAT